MGLIKQRMGSQFFFGQVIIDVPNVFVGWAVTDKYPIISVVVQFFFEFSQDFAAHTATKDAKRW